MWRRFLLLCFTWFFLCAASVQWNASVVDETHGAPDGYRVYYGTDSNQLNTTYDNGSALSFDIPDEWPGDTYYFGVRAYNASGESDWATTATGQEWVSYIKSDPPPIEPPSAATDVRVSWEQIGEPVMAFLVGQNADLSGYSLYASADELIYYRLGYSASISGTATKAYIRIQDPWTASNVKVVVYNSSGSLLATATIALSGAGWLSADLDGSVTITSGNTYYLGFILDTGYVQLYRGTTNWTCDHNTSGSYASPPASISVPGTEWAVYEPSIYLDGTTAGASAVPAIMRSYRARRN